jgi:hypothetical protein
MPTPSPKQGRAMLDVPSEAGADAMAMTPQERRLYEHHANNLRTGNYVMQPSGMISTVRQIAVQHKGRWYSVPTIWGGREVSRPEAVKRAFDAGRPDDWPSAASRQELEQRYDVLHRFMEEDVNALEIQRERRANGPLRGPIEPILSSRHSETYD